MAVSATLTIAMESEEDVTKMLVKVQAATAPEGFGQFLQTQVVPWLQERAQRRFASEGDDASGAWAPLAPATVAIRARGYWNVGPEHPINVRTGELENYITQGTSGNNGMRLSAEEISVDYPGTPPTGVLADKVLHAQQGMSGKLSYPARPVLAFSTIDQVEILHRLSIFLVDTIGL